MEGHFVKHQRTGGQTNSGFLKHYKIIIMIMIKRLTSENWKQFKGLPVDILVREGGLEFWPKKSHLDIGIVVWDAGKYCIQWQTGKAEHWSDSIGTMIEKLESSVSFYYIEIKQNS
jgi:hypothetical protein